MANTLETFLRGMETPAAGKMVLPLHPLKPSLEGWKRAFHLTRHELLWLLETFLRGMETPSRPQRHPSRLPLKPSLEGWKQDMASEAVKAARALKPSLEGWKPSRF